MKYKCLILDRDDTIVDSTRTVNFPAFLDSLSKLRPGVTMTCDEYLSITISQVLLRYALIY